MAKIDVVCPRCSETHGVIRNGHSGSGAQLYRCNQCLKTFQLNYRYNGAKPETHQAIVDMAMNGSGICAGTAEISGTANQSIFEACLACADVYVYGSMSENLSVPAM